MYMPVIVMVYVWEMVFDHIDHILFGYEIAKFEVEKTACNLVNKYFERQPSMLLSLVVHEMTRGIKGAPRNPCSKEEGCHLSEQSAYIWIHYYYTVSLLSLQKILNDVYIQRGREMFCMISRHLSWKGVTFCYPVSCRCNLLWINRKLYRSSIKGCQPWPYPAFARQNTFEAVSRQGSL